LVFAQRSIIADVITIRQAASQDAPLLAHLGAETFADTFGDDNTPENMAFYLSTAFSPEIQAAELAEPGSLFLIAEIDREPVGYARLKEGNPGLRIPGNRPVELVRLYARRQWLGQGVGAALMQACIKEAAHMGGDMLWLGVWERNPRAITFYQKWGFVQVGTQIFQMGDDPQTDRVMVLEIKVEDNKNLS
jgi:GNAT superfamily N-acetyltransferase